MKKVAIQEKSYAGNARTRFGEVAGTPKSSGLFALLYRKPVFISAIVATMAVAAGQIDEIVARRSPAPQPYAYVSGGKAVAAPKAAVDPMAGYAWDSPKATDRLQVYVMAPAGATDKYNSGSFRGLDTASRETCDIRVNGTGTILVDFGVELPAWLEFDSPDLSGDVTCAVSEYNELYSLRGNKTRAPQKVGEKTYRLVLNKELYEGVRFAFINVRKFDRPFTITAIRAVTQVMPVNYTGAFASDNPMLDRIWYVAAWDVRANIREDCFGAVLMARGDRYSWTGDAYPAQAASLVAFSNYDAVLKNLCYTECHSNRIESYELYWVESLIDYYMYSGDAEGVRALVPHALKRLDHALEIVYDPKKLGFFGWDERTGIGFDHPDCPENRRGYQMLTVGALKHFADVLDRLGERETAEKYRRAAKDVTTRLLSDDKYISRLGMHSSADAINADLLPDLSKLYHRDLSDRLQRLSYSPFNQHMLLKAMSKAGHYGDAFASVVDLWGGQVEYGATCFLEVYRPSWNKIVGKLGPVPFTQCGHTSLAHPWGAGVLQWLTEEMLGIKPVEPGFSRFAVKPHFEGRATRVSGHVNTPHGRVEASFDLKSGRHSVVVPEGTVATVAIPKEGMRVKRFVLKVNGGKRAKARPVREDGDFLCLDDLPAGRYDFAVEYEGEPRKARQEEYVYAAKVVGEDRETHGDWYRKYGRDGYVIVGGGKDKGDLAVLPDYVASVTFDTAGHAVKRHRTNGIKPLDPKATLPVNRDGSGPRVLECYHSLGLQMCPVDIRLKSPRRFRVALYVADCRQVGPFPRALNFDAFDLETLNRVAPSVRVDDLAGGVYVIFEYDRSLRIRGNNIRGDNAIINAVFFDSPDGFAAEKLGDGFVPLEWVESTGGQYIDTGVDAGAHTTIDMSFGHCVYRNNGTLFGKDVWDPQGFLFILQQGKFRFFGAKGKEPGEAWNMVAKDETEERDYRFTLGADNTARLFGADGRELCALATDRSTASHHTLWLFACDRPCAAFGQFRLYAMKIGTDAGETLRDFVPARRMNDKAVGLYDRVTKRFFANAGTGAFLAPGDQPPRGRRWSLARAREWGRTNPWYCGFNHVPANAINDVEIWAKETFSPDLIRSEFKLATDLGFNCVRIFLQYKVYEADPAWFLKAFEQYLALADEAKLKVMPVLFDDCTFWPATDPQLGKQTDPFPGWGMWGWVPSPGHTMVVDYRTHGALEKYLKDIIAHHKDDPRIFIWDLYNEPTNCMRHDRKKYAIDLMLKCFRWAREVGPSQPLTVASYRGNDPAFDEIVWAESDIVTFHCYGNAATMRRKIAAMSAQGRPVICTEWLYRPNGCDIPNILPIHKETGVGSMLWGLVNGKAQTHLPNGGFTANYKGPWKHDLFHSDHRPYSVKDLELIRASTRAATK